MCKKIIIFLITCATIITDYTMLPDQELSKNLQMLDNSLQALVLRLQPIPVENRVYQDSTGKKISIYITAEDILTLYIKKYNTKNPKDLINPNNCHAIGGPFSYYDACPINMELKKRSKEPHIDLGWGCAWRATINVFNKIQEWLAKEKNISPKNGLRPVNMYDIQRWSTAIVVKREWLEPADCANLLFDFIREWYPDDAEKILKMLTFRGHLYLKTTRENINQSRQQVIEALTSYQRGQQQKNRLFLNLKKHFNVTTDQEVLEQLYPLNQCYINTDISVTTFPKFDEKTHPFPLNIDDGVLARNVYGVHAQNNIVKHLFIGEVHVGFDGRPDNPWLAIGWETVKEIISKKSKVMILEIFPV